jgi:hypothetical protein
MPGIPQNVRVYGATVEEQDRSRGVLTVRVGFDAVADADAYDAELNGFVISNDFHSGDSVRIGVANTLAVVRIRATKAAQMPSAWSKELTTVTRPPTPPAPTRRPFELSEFGIVLAWSIPRNFPSADKASSQLARDGIPVQDNLSFDSIFVDTKYAQNTAHSYTLYIAVPADAVPAGALGGKPNVSFSSPPLQVAGAIRKMSSGRTLAFLAGMRTKEIALLRWFAR